MTTTITALPTPPSRADTPDTFSAKADAWVAAMPVLRTEINTVGDEMEVLKTDTAAIKVAADASTAAIAAGAVSDTTAIYNNTVTVYNSTNTLKSDVTTLKADVTQLKLDTIGIKDLAVTAQGLSEDARDLADTYKTQAQAAAAAAGAAAGLPSLAGNAGKALKVAAGETGVEWATISTAGVVPIDGYLPLDSSSSLVTSSGGDWLLTGVMASKASYPLAALVSYSLAATQAGVSGRATTPNSQYPGSVKGSVAVWGSSAAKVIRFDGTTWTEPTTAITATYGACNNGTLFLITTSSGTVAQTSPDGTTWTNRTVPTGTWKNMAITGMFMICLNSVAHTSPDGVTWTSRTLPANCVYFATSPTLAIFTSSASTYYTSTDLINWTARTLPFTNTGNDASVYYGDGLFFCHLRNTVGATIYSSPDGINWTARGVTPANYSGVGSAYLLGGIWYLDNGYCIKSDFTGSWIYSVNNVAYSYCKTVSTLVAPTSGATTSVTTITPFSTGYVGAETNTTISIGGKTNNYYKRVS